MAGGFTQETWREAYRGLLSAVQGCGFPAEFGKLLAENLKAERSIRRMTAYLHQARPRRVEDVADEMLAIMQDHDRWVEKKQSEEANARYNAWLSSDLRQPFEEE